MDDLPPRDPDESHNETGSELNEFEIEDSSSEYEDAPAPAGGSTSQQDWRSAYRTVMRIREFQALWLSHVLSMVGTSLLGIAATVLVYQQTGSAMASGVTFALTLLPQILGGPLLAGLADIAPRREVIIACDLIRAVFVLAISIPGLPVWALWTLLFCAFVPAMPFAAARAALLAEMVQGERYLAGSAIINMTTQGGQLLGLLLGGVVITLVGPNSTVALNAVAFLLAVLVVLRGIRFRPSTLAEGEQQTPNLSGITREGIRMVCTDHRLRTLALFSWLAGCYAVPLALANPLAAELDGAAGTVSLIMGAVPLGALVGGLVLTRLTNPVLRMRLMVPLAFLASAPLLGFVFEPPLWVILGLLAVSGVCGSYQFVTNASFVLCTPEQGRSRAFGLVASGLQAAQGIGMLLGSLLLTVLSVHATVTVAGICGIVLTLALVRSWARVMPSILQEVGAPEQPE